MWNARLMPTALMVPCFFVAGSATANPPAFHAQLRDVDKWAVISDCHELASGSEDCQSLEMGAGYLIYQSEITRPEYYEWRYLICSQSDDQLEVASNASSVEMIALVDTASCDQYALRWDEASQTWEDADSLTGSLMFDISMRDPETGYSDVRSGVESYLTSSFRYECKRNFGKSYRTVGGVFNGLPIYAPAISQAVREQCNVGLTDR